MTDDLVRLTYTGANKGPIPFKGVSGKTYYGSRVTYRFVDVLPEDVNILIRSGKFQRVAKTEEKETVETVDAVSNEPVNVEADQPMVADTDGPESDTGPVDVFMDDDLTVDLSTVESVKDSLKDVLPLANLEDAFRQEKTGEKPRKTVLDLLQNAIENHSDNVSDI